MTINYRSLFASNTFTRAQVDALRRLADAIGPLNGGDYTPSPVAVTNVTAVTASPSMWRQHGLDVEVIALIEVDPTAATTDTEITLDLPVDPGDDFTNDYDLLGIASSYGAGASGHVIAKTGDRLARVLMRIEGDVAANNWVARFIYRVSE